MSANHYAAKDDSGMTFCINVVGQNIVRYYWQVFNAAGEVVKSGDAGDRFIPFCSSPIMTNMATLADQTGYKFQMGYSNKTPCDCGR